LRQDYAEFTARDSEIVAIGPDTPEDFRRYWKENDLPFVGLADPEHQVANRYSQEVSLLKLGRMPEMIVCDRLGAIRYRHFARSMSDIPPNSEILAVLDQLRSDVSS
jgi:peroxiredoxin